MAKTQTRRNFLRTAPVAAAAALPLAETLMGQTPSPEITAPLGPHVAYTAAQISETLKTLQGNKDLIKIKGIGTSANLTVEGKHAGAEFEFHSFKDHVFYVLEGSTDYLVGGTPKGAHSVGVGDWLAPECEGYTTYKLKKGDFLSVPRMTPHKRITAESVSLLQMNGIDSNRT